MKYRFLLNINFGIVVTSELYTHFEALRDLSEAKSKVRLEYTEMTVDVGDHSSNQYIYTAVHNLFSSNQPENVFL